ncbi:unnamed protein product [Enterobius vermicularis]|uniref:Uncharacterized protein n=1 Tax=Enterobius vermicularis TaxID=51028 RepID=A0A0N4V2V9_ENTVE|nr:unnamed protein product [Enterobius vermicularis]
MNTERKFLSPNQAAKFVSGAARRQREVGRLLMHQFARCRVWEAQSSGSLMTRKRGKLKHKSESTRLLEDCEDEQQFSTVTVKNLDY